MRLTRLQKHARSLLAHLEFTAKQCGLSQDALDRERHKARQLHAQVEFSSAGGDPEDLLMVEEKVRELAALVRQLRNDLLRARSLWPGTGPIERERLTSFLHYRAPLDAEWLELYDGHLAQAQQAVQAGDSWRFQRAIEELEAVLRRAAARQARQAETWPGAHLRSSATTLLRTSDRWLRYSGTSADYLSAPEFRTLVTHEELARLKGQAAEVSKVHKR